MEQRTRLPFGGASIAAIAVFVALILLNACGTKFDKIPSLDFTEVRLAGAGNDQAAALNLMDFFNVKGLISLGDTETQVVDGGIIVYATRDGDGFFLGRKFLSSEGSVTWTLPNGPYRFYAVGYDGANMTGNKYCGIANGDSGPGSQTYLTGNARTIGFHMGTGVGGPCVSRPFQSIAAYANLLVRECLTNPGDLSLCSFSSGGFSVSFGIYARDEFFGPRSFSITDAGLKRSGCIDASSGAATIPPQEFTLGDMTSAVQFPIRSEILFYSATSCGGTLKRIVFPYGIAAAGNLSSGPPTALVDDSPSGIRTLLVGANTTAPVLYIYFMP